MYKVRTTIHCTVKTYDDVAALAEVEAFVEKYALERSLFIRLERSRYVGEPGHLNITVRRDACQPPSGVKTVELVGHLGRNFGARCGFQIQET